MSRRSSFGYSSYGPHSYMSGGYNSNRNRNSRGRKWILISVIAVVLAAVSALCLYVFIFNGSGEKKNQVSKETLSDGSGQSSGTDEREKEESASQSSVEQSLPDPELEGSYDGNVFIFDKQAYELFYGTEESAKSYASVLNSIKESLGDGVNVYSLVTPNHAAFGLPEKYLNTMSDEKKNIETIYSNLDGSIKTIDAYSALEKHRGEYIFFRTDSNWTALGAYYAYQKFCEAAGVSAVDISTLSKGTINDFTGSLINATRTDEKPQGNEELRESTDSVEYYNMKNVVSCRLLENGEPEEKEATLIAAFAEGSNAYCAFIWGDNPYMKVKTSLKTGKKLCIIKDSFGCAFAPFTAADYDEIFIVDPRYYEGSVIDYIKENSYTDLLIINNVMTANTDVRIDELKTIIN